jgi:hypothetical protein
MEGCNHGVLALNNDNKPVVEMVNAMEPDVESALVASCGWSYRAVSDTNTDLPYHDPVSRGRLLGNEGAYLYHTPTHIGYEHLARRPDGGEEGEPSDVRRRKWTCIARSSCTPPCESVYM